ncbi:hypothetical protein JY651_48880 [Pyxidicoccus parkwayensis]|uniref:Zinc-ribbon domain-containing protein n=1 Tax=Pyxidicoccus parkwayensis TaxID=2813578 RepID=A0ABX7P214_9BACT|nr:hypothetical protein [Pyxidicoccus parkwaysis]QSQ22928.1 hypothetical protein JY651_48880 [Pyxidicoccus parkwaysis]
MTPKQKIYKDMLWWTLPHLRNVATWGWWQRARDRSTYYETQLVHNLPVSMFEPEFIEHDIWFLNGQARWYCENCSARLSSMYPAQVARIRALFALVPPHLREKLEWHGPA